MVVDSWNVSDVNVEQHTPTTRELHRFPMRNRINLVLQALPEFSAALRYRIK